MALSLPEAAMALQVFVTQAKGDKGILANSVRM